MSTLLLAALTNAAIATGMFLIVWGCRRWIRNPTVLHLLWALVFIKLLTPPLWTPELAWLPAEQRAILTDERAAPDSEAAPAPESERTPVGEVERNAVAERSTTSPAADERNVADSITTLSASAPTSADAGAEGTSSRTGVDAPPASDARARSIPLILARLGTPEGIAGAIWAAGSLIWFTLAAVRVARFQRVLRLVEPAPEEIQRLATALGSQLGLRQVPRVCLVPGHVSPMLWVFFGPARIIVPAGLFAQLDEPSRAALLLHELAHYRRGDHWGRWLELVSLGIYWWLPTAWLVRRQLRASEERACDAWVVSCRPGDQRAYAELLVKTIGFISAPRGRATNPPAIATGIGSRGNLEGRLTMIMGPQSPFRLSRSLTLLVGAAALVTLPFAPAVVRAQRDAPPAAAAPVQPPTKAEGEATRADSRKEIEVLVVDEAGQPLAGASVRVQERDEELLVKADGSGICRISPPIRQDAFQLSLTALDAAGDGAGFLSQRASDAGRPPQPWRIVVKPAREVLVRVADKSGAPVAGATVGAVLPSGHDVAHGVTRDDGSLQLRFPTDAPVVSVFALKSGAGFDNWSALVEPLSPERRELPAELPLKLGGAQTARIRVVDSGERPLKGVTVFVWYVMRLGQPFQRQSFDFCRLADARSNDEGWVAFDWLPANQLGLPIQIRSAEYHLPDDGKLQTAYRSGDRELTAVLLRRTRISGRALTSEGKPIAGVAVSAQGVNRLDQDSSTARTAGDGTYAMEVAPGMTYAVGIVDDSWTAVTRRGIVVEENRPLDSLGLELIEGTVVRGTITSGADRTAFAGRSFIVSQLLGDSGDDQPARPSARFRRTATTDSQGRYELRVGPGDYQLVADQGPGTRQTIRFTVSDEAEVVRDAHLDQPAAGRRGGPLARRFGAPSVPSGMLTGEVVGPDGQPLLGATVRGTYPTIDEGPVLVPPFVVKTDAAGKFQADRLLTAMLLVVSSADGSFAAMARLDDKQANITIKLAPAATVVGRLVDGDAPVAGANVTFRLPANLRTPVQAGSAVTDAQGGFAVGGLVVGETHGVLVVERPADPTAPMVGLARMIPPLSVSRAGKIDLGYVEAPMIGTAHEEGLSATVVDIKARARRYFSDKTSLVERIATATADAKGEYRRVMLVLGDPKSAVVQSLLGVLDGLEGEHDSQFQIQSRRAKARAGRGAPVASEFERSMADFQRVHVDITEPSSVAYLARAYQLDVAKRGLPTLVVLSNESRVAAIRWFTPAGDPPKVDPVALREFVAEYSLPIRNAEERLDASLRRARAENKRVLLHQGGSAEDKRYLFPDRTESYASRLLARFVERQSAILERDYVYLNIDAYRDTNGREVLQRFRPEGTSVPWMAILDADGKKLADSDSPEGNIGYPSEPEGIAWFIDRMLKPTARNLTAVDLEKLRNALLGK